MGQKRKKMTKQQRELRRIRDADMFNSGFIMGYEMGREQGMKDAGLYSQVVASGAGERRIIKP